MEISELSLSKIGLQVSNDPSTEALISCGKGLREAFSKVGFVYIRDHGINPEVIKNAMETSKQYFMMPVEAKNERNFDVHQGYVR